MTSGRDFAAQAWDRYLSQPAQSRALAQRALDAGLAESDSQAQAHGALLLGLYELRFGEADKAREWFARAEPLLESLDDRRGQYLVGVARAVLGSEQAGVEATIAACQQTLDRYSDAIDARDAAFARNVISIFHRRRGDMEACLKETLGNVDALRAQGDSPELVVTLANAGGMLGEYGSYEESLRYAQEAIEVAERCESGAWRVSALATVAYTNLMLDRIDDALAAVEKMKALGFSGLHRNVEADVLATVGRVLLEAGHIDEARDFLARAERACESAPIDQVRLLRTVRIAQARAAQIEGRHQEAVTLYDQAVLSHAPEEWSEDGPAIFQGLARSHAVLGNAAKAFEAAELAMTWQTSWYRKRLAATATTFRIHDELASTRREMQAQSRLRAESEAQQALLAETNRELAQRLAEIEDLKNQLHEQAIRDPLTGLYNRRFFDREAHARLERADAAHQPLALVMLDIDRFKRVNDQFGHETGDQVLVTLARLLNAHLRTGDLVARIGGEEFCLLLPGLDVPSALKRSNALIEMFRECAIRHSHGELRGFTFSAGVAVFPRHGQSVQALMRSADQALYRAKHAGRMRALAAVDLPLARTAS